jgi:hypothetical protein
VKLKAYQGDYNIMACPMAVSTKVSGSAIVIRLVHTSESYMVTRNCTKPLAN